MRITIDIDDHDRLDPRVETATTDPVPDRPHAVSERAAAGDAIDAGPPTRPRSLDEEVADMAPAAPDTASTGATGHDVGGPPDLDTEE